MKTPRVTFLWLALAALACGGSLVAGEQPSGSKSALRVGVCPTLAPMIFKEGKSIVGLEADLSRLVGQRIGRSITFVELAWQEHSSKFAVAAEVRTLGGFSAQAGQRDLLKWFSVLAPGKPRVVVAHSEDGPRAALAKKIQEQFKLPSGLSETGDVIEL